MFARTKGFVAFNATLLGEVVAVGPVGEMLLVTVTTPEKPFMLVMLRREELDEPGASMIGPTWNGVCNENVGRLVNVPV
jgi:hypothetical protein